MCKTEVESLVTLVLRGLDVVVLLVDRHRVPNLVSGFVPPHKVAFDEDRHHNIPRNNA